MTYVDILHDHISAVELETRKKRFFFLKIKIQTKKNVSDIYIHFILCDLYTCIERLILREKT